MAGSLFLGLSFTVNLVSWGSSFVYKPDGYGRYTFLPLHTLLYLIFSFPLSYYYFLCFFVVVFLLEFLFPVSRLCLFFLTYFLFWPFV